MSMQTRTGLAPAVPAMTFSIMSRCSAQSTITVMAAAATGSAASRPSAPRSAVG